MILYLIIGSVLLLLAIITMMRTREKSNLQNKIEILLSANGKLLAQTDHYKELIIKLENESEKIKGFYVDVQNKLHESNKMLEIQQHSNKELEKRFLDWETSRTEALHQAKAAIFDTASKLTNELLEKHKHESKASEEKISKTTSDLYKHFESITNTIAILNNDVKNSKHTVEQVKKALLSPAGAGTLAEITLENILKASGLISNRDFEIQYSFTTQDSQRNTLRPDAIVFLPNNNLMIIDSKASKYFTEIIQEDANNQEINTKLKTTMRNHIKNLVSKDYKDSIRQHLKDAKINHISTIMFLPSDSAIEKLSEIDRDFMSTAWSKDIMPVGPSGLISILNYAKFQIAINKQTENQQLIIDEVGKLIASFKTIYEHAQKVGTNLYTASNSFDKFARSFNANIIPKARHLEKLGVHIQKNKALPKNLDRFTLVSSSETDLIEVEADSTTQEDEQ
ncbi:MAG: DNA recombination protein RmuC [Rickettsiales bacterium]|nr:DNA recombination protein RmuC [Rickettsiales bacterium]